TSVFVNTEDTTVYDFSINAANAYGSNQVAVEPGVWAFWSGDVTDGFLPVQDGFVESGDYSLIENNSQSFFFGYEVTDLSGDALVESSDYGLIENNSQLFLIASHP
ncbi:MAG TPA: hypothetical protein PLU53_10670, partial [Bacteroidia bacterium]|nr:hypothetical protein [Bacteroidia bacterium]